MSLPKIRNPFSDPLGAFVDLSLLPVTLPTMTLGGAGLAVGEKALEGVGLKETKEAKAAREAEESRVADEARRSELYNAATQDNSIDEISRRELIGLFQEGANTGKVASLLAAAREGKGIYAVRKVNQAQQEFMRSQPGRAQLSNRTGRGSLL